MQKLFRRLGADTRYVLVGFPTAVLAFALLVVGASLGLGLAVLVVGLPVLAVTLRVARGFATAERSLAPMVLGHSLGKPRYRATPAGAGWFATAVAPLRCGQSWMDFAHGILRFPLAVGTFVVALVWWAGTLAGLTYPAYGWLVHAIPGNTGLMELLGYGDGLGISVAFHTGAGILFAVTLPAAVRGAALLQATLTQGFLAPVPVAEVALGEETSRTEPKIPASVS